MREIKELEKNQTKYIFMVFLKNWRPKEILQTNSSKLKEQIELKESKHNSLEENLIVRKINSID